METKTINGLTTYTGVSGSTFLQGEPVEFYNVTEWDNLTNLRDGMFNNLKSSILAEYENYLSGDLLAKTSAETYSVFNAVWDIIQYREDYLKRRICALEQALNLSHNGDIDD